MNNSIFYQSYWHIQSFTPKDWLFLKSFASAHDISISLLINKKSQFSKVCVASSKTFSNHHSLIQKFSQITNKKMTLLMYQTKGDLFSAPYSKNPALYQNIVPFLQTSLGPLLTTMSQILHPWNTFSSILLYWRIRGLEPRFPVPQTDTLTF